MINALIFDLDGTLVQTERLKADSYAQAAVELRPDALDEDEVREAFKDVVGLSRQEVAQTLLERFDLEEAASARMEELEAGTPWEAYVSVRLDIYHDMLSDPEIIRQNRWPHNVALLEAAEKARCQVALATMSHREQAERVLEILELREKFACVATRDDVNEGKPDPEIYQLVSETLQVPPTECLVIEDSPSGIQAALAAGMHCIAVPTPFTRARILESELLPPERIVDEGALLIQVANRLLMAE